MKNILVFISLFTSFHVLCQTKDSVLMADKQRIKDSVYFNRFNKGNKHLGAFPILTFGSDDEDNKYRLYGARIEGGYFIKNKLLAFASLISQYAYIKVDEYPDEKYYHFGNVLAPGLRYYLAPKRFTFYGQMQVNYSYLQADTVLSTNNPVIKSHSFGISAGAGMTFSFNVFDFSLYMDYMKPLSYSKEFDFKHRFPNYGLRPGFNVSVTF